MFEGVFMGNDSAQVTQQYFNLLEICVKGLKEVEKDVH